MKPVVQHAVCRWPLALLVLALAFGAAAPVVRAEDLQLEATLIQGANDSPATVNHTLADDALSAGLRRNFPWTNYYEITNLAVTIPLDESRDVKMSDHCVLKIRNLGSSRVAVDCIGHGKQLSKGTNTLPFILGSDDTNHTAWFVSLRASDSETATAETK